MCRYSMGFNVVFSKCSTFIVFPLTVYTPGYFHDLLAVHQHDYPLDCTGFRVGSRSSGKPEKRPTLSQAGEVLIVNVEETQGLPRNDVSGSHLYFSFAQHILSVKLSGSGSLSKAPTADTHTVTDNKASGGSTSVGTSATFLDQLVRQRPCQTQLILDSQLQSLDHNVTRVSLVCIEGEVIDISTSVSKTLTYLMVAVQLYGDIPFHLGTRSKWTVLSSRNFASIRCSIFNGLIMSQQDNGMGRIGRICRDCNQHQNLEVLP